jgi:hypothetical protein
MNILWIAWVYFQGILRSALEEVVGNYWGFVR